MYESGDVLPYNNNLSTS